MTRPEAIHTVREILLVDGNFTVTSTVLATEIVDRLFAAGALTLEPQIAQMSAELKGVART